MFNSITEFGKVKVIFTMYLNYILLSLRYTEIPIKCPMEMFSRSKICTIQQHQTYMLCIHNSVWDVNLSLYRILVRYCCIMQIIRLRKCTHRPFSRNLDALNCRSHIQSLSQFGRFTLIKAYITFTQYGLKQFVCLNS